MNKEKEYSCNVTLKFCGNSLQAKNKKEYIKVLKETFYDELGLEISDKEITDIEEKDCCEVSNML